MTSSDDIKASTRSSAREGKPIQLSLQGALWPAVGILALLSSCDGLASPDYVPPSRESRESIEDVSLVAVIANPERFNEKLIRTYGYFVHRPEETVLYLSRESAENLILVNSVVVDLSDGVGVSEVEKFRDKYVLIEGRFHENRPGGPVYMTSGAIVEITRIEALGGTTGTQ